MKKAGLVLLLLAVSVIAAPVQEGRPDGTVTGTMPLKDDNRNMVNTPMAEPSLAAGNYIFCAMGSGTTGAYLKTAERGDYSGVLAWAYISDVPYAVARRSLAGAHDGTNFYVMGGQNPGTDTVFRWDGTTWTLMASMPEKLMNLQAAYYNGKIYIPGGQGGGGNTLKIYDIATNTWSFGPTMPTAKAGNGVTVCNNYLYSIGGTPSYTPVYRIDLNNLASGWQTMAPHPSPGIYYGAATSLGGYIYTHGFMTPVPPTPLASRYDPATDTWTSIANPNVSRHRPGMVGANGKVYLFGGGQGSSWTAALNSVEVYDPANPGLGWQYTTPMAEGRIGPAAAAPPVGSGAPTVDIPFSEQFGAGTAFWFMYPQRAWYVYNGAGVPAPSMRCDGWNLKTMPQGLYLVSPGIKLQDALSCTLKFFDDYEGTGGPVSLNSAMPQGFTVEVATQGGPNPLTANFTPVWTYNPDIDGDRNWKKEIVIDLSAYIGQTIWVAWVHPGAPESWMVDSVYIYEGQAGIHDVGVSDILKPEYITPTGTPVGPKAIFKNFGGFNETFGIWCEIRDGDGNIVFNDDDQLSLPPGDEQEYEFDAYDFPEGNMDYEVSFFTTLEPVDQRPENDLLTRTTHTMLANDVACIQITAPDPGNPEDYQYGDDVSLKAIYGNVGGDDQNAFPTSCVIKGPNGNEVYNQTANCPDLAAGDQTEVTYPNWTIGTGDTDGKYTITFTAQLTGDGNAANDAQTVEVNVTGIPGVADAKGKLPKWFDLSVAKPNPMVGSSVINYALPHTSRITITLYDISGKFVKTLVTGTKDAGYFSAGWNGKDDFGRPAPKGIYFVRMDTPEYSATNKLILVR